MNTESTTRSRTRVKTNNLLSYTLLAAAILSAGTIGMYLYTFSGGLSQDNEKWGAFGSFLGGALGPILSFLSLIALITTIRIQLEELELTRDELRRTANAQAASERHLKKQARVLENQQFENSFYALLTHHNNILKDVTSRKRSDSDSRSIFDSTMATINRGNTSEYEAEKLISKADFLEGYFKSFIITVEFIVKNKKTSNDDTNEKEHIYLDILMSFITNNMLIAFTIYSGRQFTEVEKRLHKIIEDCQLIKKSNLLQYQKSDSMIRRFPKNFPQEEEIGSSN